MADALPHPLWTQDADGAFDFANTAWRAYTRVAGERMTRDDWAAIVAPEDFERTMRTLGAALLSSTSFETEVRIRPLGTGDDGYRWHLVRSAPVIHEGRVVRWIGTATDIDGDHRAADGLRILARASAVLSESLELAPTLHRLARIVSETLADFCLIDVAAADGRGIELAAWSHVDVARDPSLERAGEHLQRTPGYPPHPVREIVATGLAHVVSTIDDAWIAANAANPEHAEFMRATRYRSAMFVPIAAAGRCLGAMTLVRCAAPGGDGDGDVRHYDALDLSYAEELGRRAGLAIANGRRFEREARIAAAFQRASLPALAAFPGTIAVDAFYRPGRDEATIGGDWYDAYALADGRIALTIGDVLGKGLAAAVTMAKLRNAMQVASDERADPIAMLAAADRVLRREGDGAYATAIAAIYDPAARTMQLATAGHPGPAARFADGRIAGYEHPGMMLGLWRGREALAPRTIDVPPETSLVFYTDGLVEFAHDLDAGVAALHAAMRRPGVLDAARPAAALVDATLAGHAPTDDVAVLIVRTPA